MTGIPATLDVHALLAEQDFVRRIARSLVFDQDRVDDIVQEAWLAVLRHPPRDAGAVRTWFGRVTENLARRRSRDETRRTRRERAAAQPEALPAVDAVLAHEELRAKVVAAVVALDEPYRGVLLARYFEGLEPSAIAVARGVPAATVRSQVKRGLDLLRLRLDATHGDRRTWCLALLPLARPEPATGLLASLTLATGALLVTKLLLLAGGIALAVLGTIWLTRSPSDLRIADTAVVADHATTEAPLGVASRPTSSEPSAERALPRTDWTESRPAPATVVAGFRGRLLDPKGAPARGELVRFLGVDPLAMFADAGADEVGLGLVRSEARTADDGTFVVRDLRARGSYAAQLGADGPHRTVVLLAVTPSPEEVVDLGDLHLVAKAGLTGRVLDEDGTPIAGATILCLDLPALLRAVLPFDRFEPAHGGFLSFPIPDSAELANPTAYAARLRNHLATELFMSADLDRRPGLAIQVVDRMPWLEELWNELPIARATSARDGTFSLQGAQPGANWLVVRKPGFATGGANRIVLKANEVRALGDVRLTRGESLRGQVCDVEGRPVARAEIRVAMLGSLGYRGVAFCEAPVTAGGDGRFVVSGLTDGRAIVAARRSADEPWTVVGPVDVGEDLALRLPAKTALTLALTDTSGTPVDRPRIEVRVGPALGELARIGVQQRLPAGARITFPRPEEARIDGLLPGCYTLLASAPGMVLVEAMVQAPRTEPLRLELARATELTLRVSDSKGTPLAGTKVYLQSDLDATRAILPTSYGLPRWRALPVYLGATAADGSLRTAQRPAREVTLHAMHPHHGWSSKRVDVATTEVKLVLAEPGTITGRLYDHGTPADPARHTIEVTCLDAAPGASRESDVARAALRADSTFEIRGLAPGRYRVSRTERKESPLSLGGLTDVVRRVTFGGWYLFEAGEGAPEVEVTSGAVKRVDFDLDPNTPVAGVASARIRGHFTLGGKPVSSALCCSRSANTFVWHELSAIAEDGGFVAEHFQPGRVTLAIRASDGTFLWSRDLLVEPGADLALEVRLPAAVVRGTVTFPAGFPLAGALVSLEGRVAGGFVQRSVRLGVDGTFRIEAVPHGSYRIEVVATDGKCKPRQLEVVGDEFTVPSPLVLEEVLVLRGRVVGLAKSAEAPWLVLAGANRKVVVSLGEAGEFGFSDLPPATYRLSLEDPSGTGFGSLEPATVDLSRGSQRDLEVRFRDR